MSFDLIFTIVIFLFIFILAIIWSPSRTILKEIFFHPLKESKLKLIEKPREAEKSNKTQVKVHTPQTSSKRESPA